ncbi:MAG: ABC transporter permease subunit [Gammaproteobacteria bacterium]
MIGTIAKREFKSLFLSPFGWVLLAVMEGIPAYLFLVQIDIYLTAIQSKSGALDNFPGTTDLLVTPLYGNAGVIMLMLTPLLTMRSISAERHNRTLPLLISAPLSTFEIVLGKYLGIQAFNLLVLVIISLMPLSLEFATDLDYGKVAACMLAFALVAGSFSAVGLYLSSLAGQPSTAAGATFGVLLVLWILDWGIAATGLTDGVFPHLSLLGHFNRLRTGLVSSADLIYYCLIILIFLGLAMRRLKNEGESA